MNRTGAPGSKSRASQVLAVLNQAGVLASIIILLSQTGSGESEEARILAGIFYASGLLVADTVWFILTLTTRQLDPSPKIPTIPTMRQSLSRPQSLVAWLIFHTAFLPLLILGALHGSMQLSLYLAFLAAVLVMGILPVGLIVWLDRYLASKLQA